MQTTTERLLRYSCLRLLALVLTFCWSPPLLAEATTKATPVYSMSPIGWVRKAGGKSFIEVEPRYQAALLGVDELPSLWVFWWFDRNDTPDKRAILQVHPRGHPDNPLRGVFATRSPFRPNLIALTQVKVITVRGNVIEIGDIDAFADTPVLDLKPY